MQIKTDDGTRNVASAGVGGTGLGLGIAGTALGLLNGGANWLIGNNKNSNCHNGHYGDYEHDTRIIGALEAENGKLKGMRYTDSVGVELYREIVALSNKNDDKINANYKELAQFITALDKQVAVDKKEIECNFAFLNNKIDEKARELRCYVDATFVPGELKMPLQKICPEAMRRFNSWVAPTNPAPDTQPVNVARNEG